MRTHYDPWARPSARQRTVPLDTALALRERAEQAVRALEASRRQLGAAERQASVLREALHDAESTQLALREALREARRPEPRPEPEPAPDLDAAVERTLASLRADLANLRRHQDAAVLRARRQGREELLLPMVDTLDDLHRARIGAHAAVAEGLDALFRRLHQRLQAGGVTVFGAVGDPFDPARHEALGTAPGRSDLVVEVLGHGLSDPDGVLRPARVVVGDGTPAPGGAR